MNIKGTFEELMNLVEHGVAEKLMISQTWSVDYLLFMELYYTCPSSQ
jgi:hypothetical protein